MNIFRKKENVDMPASYEIVFNNAGFPNIKIGDKFEGAACGTWFKNQECTHIDGELIYGTTTLVVFRKENIRPIKDTNIEPIKVYHK